ncbi:ATP-binding protein, partial [Candidatus Woesearchaeota archaeon]|nr:ATP-binding protein [Candidatus Woesearchaeota archaeon]
RQLIAELLDNGVDKKQILYLNLDDYRLKKHLTVDLFEQAYDTYLNYSRNDEKTYFFIDEIQEIQGWESYLKTMYDLGKKIKFIITGSNATLLSKELSSLLTGRNLTFQILPLMYKEFQRFKKGAQLEEYIKYGGFPEVVLEQDENQKRRLLQQYFEDILNKDIVSRHSIRNVDVIYNLARGLVENSGGKVSLNKLGKQLGVSTDTVSLYLGYLRDAYLIIKVPFFSYSLKKRHSVLAKPKYYSADNGFCLIVSMNHTKDLGKRYENAAMIKLYRSTKEISYWASEGEVDFIYRNKALNITTGKNISDREYKGLFEFKTKHRRFDLILVSAEPGQVSGIKEYDINQFFTQNV